MDQAEIKLFLKKYSDENYSEADHNRFMDWLNHAPMREIEQVAGGGGPWYPYCEQCRCGIQVLEYSGIHVRMNGRKAIVMP